ncbi:MAG TPA: DUF333 domain-containing protein [Candidatus Paceibacterota bacterium]|nr:DUF333 domain-containing protein [Candidatus Paceibacterota bacterium]
MTKKDLIIFVVVLIAGVYYWMNSDGIVAKKEATEIANPAAVYCVEQGGKSEIKTNPDGSQYGICITKDKQECDEWEYYRGGCVRNQ